MTAAWSQQLVSEQRRFLASFQAADPRNTVYYGRLEPRSVRSEAAHELIAYLSSLKTKIDPTVYRDLFAIGNRHKYAQTLVEKAVDVMLAVDLVVMAQRNEFDTAYILSADGDYTHAAQFVRDSGCTGSRSARRIVSHCRRETGQLKRVCLVPARRSVPVFSWWMGGTRPGGVVARRSRSRSGLPLGKWEQERVALAMNVGWAVRRAVPFPATAKERERERPSARPRGRPCRRR